MTGARARSRARAFLLTISVAATLYGVSVGETGDRKELPGQPKNPWHALIAQADALGLPTRFLRLIPPDFVTLEFDDLHAFAAEYHPEEHRMVLNRSLSFNEAGGALRPLAKLTHRELGTLYHELFHAYMDYLAARSDSVGLESGAARLLAFAKEQQACRYQQVVITPVVQRKSVTEARLLTDRESWEALNETWAVFVGWAIWTRLEVSGGRPARRLESEAIEKWLRRLKKADRDGDLVGYYEPEDPAERSIARKRYLAASHGITPREIALLLDVLLESAPDLARRSAAAMEPRRSPAVGTSPCPE